MKKSIFLLLLFSLVLFGQEWIFENSCLDWRDTRNLTAIPTPQGLDLSITGLHSNIAAYKINFAADGRNYLAIEYSASGMSRSAGGYCFFGTADAPTLDEEKKFYLPQLNCDGKPHEMLVNLKSAARANAFDIWSNASAITKLRLDFEPDVGGTILLKSIRLLNLNEDEVNARIHKTDVAKGIPLKLEVDMPNAEKTEAKNADKSTGFVSRMVSPDKEFAYSGVCFLRREFQLDSPVVQTLWQSSCDDVIEEVWLNGHLVEREWSTVWQKVDSFALSKEYFTEGRNVLAVRYRNNGDLGGLMMDLQLVLANDDFQVITMEESRALAGGAPVGWEMPDFDDSGWSKVFVRPGPPAAPWTNFQAIYKSIQGTGSAVQVSVVKNDLLAVDVLFTHPAGFRPGDIFQAYFCGPNGQVLEEFSGTATELNGVPVENGIQFHFTGVPGEFYGLSCQFHWEFGIRGRKTEGQNRLAVKTEDHPMEGEALSVEVAQTERGPVPMLNGKPFFFNVLTAHNYKDSDAIHTGMEGKNSPFNVVAIRLGGMGNTWWVGPDRYDFSEVDRSLNTILRRYPDSLLGIYVWCQPGGWYTTTYPERMSHMEDGSIYKYYVSAVDFANADYRADAVRALTALVEHLEKYFGPKVFLYNLMGGISCEWQGWAAHSDQYADFSEGGKKEFLDYAALSGVEAAAVPTRADREASIDGIFRSPAENALAILYDKYYSESIAECVAQLATATKEACHHRKLVGCYYGYLMEYASLGHCTNGGGHNALQLLLDCPDMDFFLSPQSYAIRSLGAPNADMKPYGAIYNAGKFSMMEDDTRTHLTFKTDFEQTLNLECTLNVLKRNVGMSLAHATPLNHLPLVGGNELNHPAIRAMFTRTMQAGQYLLENGSHPAAEIAAVIDEDAIRYLAATRARVEVPDHSRYMYSHDGTIRDQSRSVQPVTGDLLYYQRIPLAQFGAPVDVVLLDDIVKNPAKYKMVIFLNAVKDKPELRQAIQALRASHVKIVFTYGTGFLDEQGISAQALSANVGMEMAEAGEGILQVSYEDNGAIAGQPYKARTRFKVLDDAATPIAHYSDTYDVAVAEKDGLYFYGATDLDPEFLRMVARNAGVHIFLEEDDNLYASRDVISIHASHAGHKVVQLPRQCDVVDLYSGEVVARQVTSFEFDMKAFDTRVFLTGDAEKILSALK